MDPEQVTVTLETLEKYIDGQCHLWKDLQSKGQTPGQGAVSHIRQAAGPWEGKDSH